MSKQNNRVTNGGPHDSLYDSRITVGGPNDEQCNNIHRVTLGGPNDSYYGDNDEQKIDTVSNESTVMQPMAEPIMIRMKFPARYPDSELKTPGNQVIAIKPSKNASLLNAEICYYSLNVFLMIYSQISTLCIS